MKVKTITYHKVFSLGNFQNEKIGTEIEITEGDNVQNVIQKAREFVEYNHKLNGILSELNQAQHVVDNADNFTGAQVKKAQEIINKCNDVIEKGQKLLSL